MPVWLSQGSLSRHRQERRAGVLATGSAPDNASTFATKFGRVLAPDRNNVGAGMVAAVARESFGAHAVVAGIAAKNADATTLSNRNGPPPRRRGQGTAPLKSAWPDRDDLNG